jgi:Double zinc ribbon
MSFLEDLFERPRRHGHGRGHGHHDDHDHEYDYDDGHDRRYGPAGGHHGAPPFAGAPSIQCPRCNAVTPLTPGARFCASCGGPLAAEPTCKGCGMTLTRGAAFCQGCGAKVG